jgi:hypothetical protein
MEKATVYTAAYHAVEVVNIDVRWQANTKMQGAEFIRQPAVRQANVRPAPRRTAAI